jgi:hypothetical protein
MTRAVAAGSATATLAVGLALLPTTSKAHGNNPLRSPHEPPGGPIGGVTVP